MWNSVISTEGARFMGIDIKSFFITAELDRYEYMKMPLDVFPQHVREQYDLDRHIIHTSPMTAERHLIAH
jgi:hypothetical protein